MAGLVEAEKAHVEGEGQGEGEAEEEPIEQVRHHHQLQQRGDVRFSVLLA